MNGYGSSATRLLYSTSCAGFNIMCTLQKVRNVPIIYYT